MPEAPSLFSLAAAGIYVITIFACGTAGLTARARYQPDWHFRVWITVSAIYIVLVLSRLFVLEDIVRESMRAWLEAEGLTQERRTWQSYVLVSVIVLSILAGFFVVYSVSRRMTGKRNMAVLIAALSGFAMLALVGLRVISLHAMDRLLFGPLKLNWFGDLGLTLLIMGCAAFYIRRVRLGPPKRRKAADPARRPAKR